MFRIGQGYDIHATIAGKSLWMGGLEIPAPFSLKGHSDADVLLHAITDAIFGALGEPDIGFHFPPTDAANKNRPSQHFLLAATKKMKKAGYRLVNMDCTVICENPKILPHREAIRQSIAEIMGVDGSIVNLKGRTNEKLGAIGREEGVAAMCVVLLGRGLCGVRQEKLSISG